MTTPIPGWHPMLVHFPLALIVTATACLTIARVAPAHRLARTLALVGTWNLGLGAAALVFTLGSGLAAVIGLDAGAAAHRAIAAHVKAALVSALLVGLAGVWRCAGTAPESRPSPVFLAVLWAAAAMLIVTGYRGGQNVYRYGVGVEVQSVPR